VLRDPLMSEQQPLMAAARSVRSSRIRVDLARRPHKRLESSGFSGEASVSHARVRARLRRYVDEVGERRASVTIGLSRHALTRAIAGLTIYRGSALLIEVGLERTNAASAAMNEGPAETMIPVRP